MQKTCQLLAKTCEAGIDVLVNNAGGYYGKGGMSIKLGVEDVVKTFRLNTVAPMLFIQLLHPLLMKKKTRKVINMSSRHVLGLVALHV